LDLLAGDAFADAFARSTNQNDYRWGKLHRVTFAHAFGSGVPEFSIPTAGDFEDLSPTLPGLAVDGGFETIDNGAFSPEGASSAAYVFNSGAARRYVSEARRQGIKSVQVIPGGTSGVAGNRFHANQLQLWLRNDYHQVLFTDDEINKERFSRVIYSPSN
jgi:penicillin G amidase